jgi:hypothetical protein
MNFDPTSVVPDYPSAEAEKALDLEKWNVAPAKQGPVAPPASGGSGGGMAIVIGLAAVAIAGTAVVLSVRASRKKGKR